MTETIPSVSFAAAVPDLRAEQLSVVARTLCVKSWDMRSLDEELHLALNQCVRVLNCIGIVAYFGEGPVVLQHFAPGVMPSPAEARETGKAIVAKILDELSDDSCPPHVVVDSGGFHLVAGTCMPSTSVSSAPVGFCVLVYPNSPDDDAVARQKIDIFHATSTVGLIYQVLLHRVRVFSPFAPRTSERYWDAVELPEGQPRLVPPWARSTPWMTATLSLDLRKSTFCMDNAEPPAKFARWLDELVQILTRVTHLHGGVFDKFTGDGALVHFIADDEGDTPVGTALDCAISMHRAMARHVADLRTFLRVDCELLGAGIGIDVGPTHWSIDHRNNPITVGTGVVHACRVGDKTEAGATRLTNLAYQQLSRSRDLSQFHSVRFASKEHGDEMKLLVWELPAGARPVARFDTVDAIVDDVYARRTPDGP
jgi:class 3 adenylate cyclase